ncbi:MAG: CGNR zinc finger domain-containing protein [Actinomycetota bacterium]|nr:CGNR zinc finger domain-containing protein [Actinomycetota bacterium]
MYFAHDTETALIAAAALINTAVRDAERLASPADLDRFLDEHPFGGRRDGTEQELAAVRDLRSQLRGLWCTDDVEELVAQVNDLLERTSARPRLVRHDGWDWHLHVTEPHAPLVDRMGAEAAMALVDVVRGEDVHRLRTCAAEGCDAVLVDLSRNSSRRFCDIGNCANRTHVAALRARRRAAGSGGTTAASGSASATGERGDQVGHRRG